MRYMSIILIRTVIIYVVLVGAMRLMGKRQLGQLEVSDLVSTLLLSEIAALPIENHSIPLVYAIIPIILVLAAEVFSAALLSRFPGLKNILSTRPTVLVKMGKPREDELKRALKEYKGTILLICHEPEFYQDIVTEVWNCEKWTTKVH